MALVSYRAILDTSRAADGSATPPSHYVLFLLFVSAIFFSIVYSWITALFVIFRLVYPLQEEEQLYMFMKAGGGGGMGGAGQQPVYGDAIYGTAGAVNANSANPNVAKY